MKHTEHVEFHMRLAKKLRDRADALVAEAQSEAAHLRRRADKEDAIASKIAAEARDHIFAREALAERK